MIKGIEAVDLREIKGEVHGKSSREKSGGGNYIIFSFQKVKNGL